MFKEDITHRACNKRIKDEGGKARCCDCVPHESCEYTEPKKDRYTVKMGDYAFMAFLETMVAETEVIGNIYEHSHLLPQDKEGK